MRIVLGRMSSRSKCAEAGHTVALGANDTVNNFLTVCWDKTDEKNTITLDAQGTWVRLSCKMLPKYRIFLGDLA